MATDRLGLTAMRAGGLLALLASEGCPVDRSGGGIVVEVYPAAALKVWGLGHAGYKRGSNRAQRVALIDDLLAEAPWLDLAGHRELCETSDDALDAVIAALIARAAALSLVSAPEQHQRGLAEREGWIVLPIGPLSGLVAPADQKSVIRGM